MKTDTQTAVIIRFAEVVEQGDNQLLSKLIGTIDAENFCKLISKTCLKANPRDSKTGSVTEDIRGSLIDTPSLFNFKSKGILISSSVCEKLERNRYRLSFVDPELEGILDGGHNTLSIGMYLIEEALGEEVLKGVRRWNEFASLWAEHHDEIFAFCKGNDEFQFFIPVEVLFPSRSSSGPEEFYGAILEIAQARNNNTQLTKETKANKQGHYDFLRSALDEVVSSQIEWRSNDGGRLKAREVVSLSLIPLSFLAEEILGSKINLVKIHSSKGSCVDEFDRFIEAEGIAKTKDGAIKELVDERVKSALLLMREIPRLADLIYTDFPAAYNANEGRWGGIKCVKKSNNDKPAGHTKFYRTPVEWKYPEGFITPLFVGLTELIKREGDVFSWKVPAPEAFLKKMLPTMLATYKGIIEGAELDPQKVGKIKSSYELARISYRSALIDYNAN